MITIADVEAVERAEIPHLREVVAEIRSRSSKLYQMLQEIEQLEQTEETAKVSVRIQYALDFLEGNCPSDLILD